MNGIRSGAIIVATLVLSACAGAGTPPASSAPPPRSSTSPAPSNGPGGPDGLDGTWVLTGGTLRAAQIPIIPDAAPTLEIHGAEVGGRAACNAYGGTADVDGTSITLHALSMTEMGCSDDLMASEAAYLEALAGVDTLALDADRLTLSGPDVELVFAFVPPTPDATLVGTTWVLDTLISGELASSVSGDPATLELRDDGTLAGSTGCRTFGASYTASGADVAVTELTNDDRACLQGVESQDEHVLSVIADGFAASIDGDQLTLMSPSGLGLGYHVDRPGG